MKKLLFCILFMLCFTPAANAQNTTCATRPVGDSTNACASTAFVSNPANAKMPTFVCASSRWVSGGAAGAAVCTQPNVLDVTNATPKVSNNTELSALSTSYNGTVIRFGFASSGDSPPVTFTYSASPCSLNGGAGNGGSQVPRTAGGCWIADPTMEFTPQQFGAKADGVTNDQPALLAWLNVGGALKLPPGTYSLGTKINTTLPRSTSIRILPNASIVVANSSGINWDYAIRIDSHGYDFTIDSDDSSVFDGSNTTNVILQIYNKTSGAAHDPDVSIQHGRFINAKMLSTAGQPTNENTGLQILGLYQNIALNNISAFNITRDAGAGVPGSQGTSGITVAAYYDGVSYYWPKAITIKSPYCVNITTANAYGSIYRTDADCVKAYTGLPSGSLTGTIRVVDPRCYDVIGYCVKLQSDFAVIESGYDSLGIQGITNGKSSFVIQSGNGSIRDAVLTLRTNGSTDITSTIGSVAACYTATARTIGYLGCSAENITLDATQVPAGTASSIVDLDNTDTNPADGPKFASARNVKMLGNSVVAPVRIGTLGNYTDDTIMVDGVMVSSATTAMLVKSATSASKLRGTIRNMVNLGTNVPMIRTAAGTIPSASVGSLSDLGGNYGVTPAWAVNSGASSPAAPYFVAQRIAPRPLSSSISLDGGETPTTGVYCGYIANNSGCDLPATGSSVVHVTCKARDGGRWASFLFDNYGGAATPYTISNPSTLWATGTGSDPGTASKIAIWQTTADSVVHLYNRLGTNLGVTCWLQ